MSAFLLDLLPSVVGLLGVLVGYWLGAPPRIPMPPPIWIANTTPPATAELKAPDWIEAWR